MSAAYTVHACTVPTPSSPLPSPDLLRPDLWEHLLPGLLAARHAGRAYAETGRYLPRQSRTDYSENDAGWPQTTADLLSSGSKGVLDWGELFSLHEGRYTHLLATDIPDLASSLRRISDQALADEALLRGLSRLAPHIDDADERREQIEFETLRLLLGRILNRADAVDAEAEDDLRRIYAELEQARFAAELTGDVVVPLVAVTFELDEPIRLDTDIWLEPLTEADHRARALPWHRHDTVNPYVAAGATHAVVTRGVRFPNTLRQLRPPSPPDGLSTIVAESVHEAVDIVTGRATGYAQILVRPHGWAESWVADLPPLWSAWTGRGYPEELNERRWDRSFETINAADTEQIVQIARALTTAPNNVRIAARRCRRVSFRDDAEDRLLDAAIGLEALLGKEPDALTHRLAQRAAVALADQMPPENTYSLVKQFYGTRSKIAHGVTPKRMTCRLGDNEWSAVSVGRFLLRELLKTRLLADEPWDAESLDEKMLTALGRLDGYPMAGDG
ncbi:HEPN domain-containing protein [Jiangella gansuensis]|uniref:HEPN domain-containing protein n=1 Tax=Jiangella gansuensis TaxID=281473 RepID=UPI0012F745E4|nr:HEPN domain-containing protein [Jiangella gansuensis]